MASKKQTVYQMKADIGGNMLVESVSEIAIKNFEKLANWLPTATFARSSGVEVPK